MKIYNTGKGSICFELTEEEEAAIEDAKLIVAQRAAEEKGEYDERMLDWWLCGLLRERGIEGMLRQAREAKFHKKHVPRVGYSY